MQQPEARPLQAAFDNIMHPNMVCCFLSITPGLADDDLIYGKLAQSRHHAVTHMRTIMHTKRNRRQLWGNIGCENDRCLVVLPTMNGFVKWRTSDLSEYLNRLMQTLRIRLICMSESESFDLRLGVEALSNLQAETLCVVRI